MLIREGDLRRVINEIKTAFTSLVFLFENFLLDFLLDFLLENVVSEIKQANV